MNEYHSTKESHLVRSNFIKGLIQNSKESAIANPAFTNKIPKKIIQFWDNLDQLPMDVSECLETWRKVEEQGFKRLLYDKNQARNFISHRLGKKYKQAYDKCYHPAMQSDYFRLCYIFVEGGCYIDADDVYEGADIRHLFNDGRLKIQPLCYDGKTNVMVPPSLFTLQGAGEKSWIFYFNNNPLIATCKHPIVELALETATFALKRDMAKELPDIQSTTGPGNLTKSIFDIALKDKSINETIQVLCDWEKIATSKWPLSYRNDNRNWRFSDCKRLITIDFKEDE